MSGTAGNNIVSPYIVSKIDEPKIAKVNHAEVDIVFFLAEVLYAMGRDGDAAAGLSTLSLMLTSPFFSFTIYLYQT
jgi:hypothetical protein